MDTTTMEAACASTQRIVDGLGTGRLDLPTPCDQWTVRQLLNHLVGALYLGEALLTGTEPSVAMSPGGLPDSDLLGDDPVKAYRAATEHLLGAATPDAFARMLETPMGELPGAILAGFTTLDIVVHGWDLATATGQPATIDDELATKTLAFAHQALAAEMRGPLIGPVVAVDTSAPVTDRLVGFLGRTP